MLHGHGDDGYRHAGGVRANFSSNVRPGGLPAGLSEHLAGCIERVSVYPEVAAETLTARLARAAGVAPENVLVTAGGTAAIYLVAQAFRARRSCVVIPTFAEYEDACAANGHRLEFLRWEEFVRGARVGGDLLWLCNPNNPTGAVLARATLLDRISAQPETLFVVDQAYADFCAEPALTPRECLTHPNLLLLQSLTKRFGIPGLRIGSVAGAVETITALRRLQPPWAVGALELAAGEFSCRTDPDEARGPAGYLEEARQLQHALASIDGVEVEPSSTGFFLVRLAKRTGAELKAYLLEEHGFLVRDAGNFRGLDERCVRIAAQEPERNRALVEAIRRWMRT